MKRLFFSLLLIAFAPLAHAANPHVLFTTNQGNVEIELFADKAPKSVENFLGYVNKGHYNGTIFHRVIAGFVAQGGGYSADMQEKPTGKPIQNEANNGLMNSPGTLAMARTNDPHSASAQFYINLRDNAALNYRESTPRGWGYAVFGKVVKGMDVVEKMADQPTGVVNGMPDVPLKPIIIMSAKPLP
ncbi:peptidylprolyl isomerase [Chitinimonas sp. BJB300]|uniref:peptidylprolyl isomerase n=1 Tax=Chitinimonas sp. BJB300 TaxID=1559339 RepID=UPI000C10A569|nr:peptidylprolyl isomerase [Chitinimonas sp. BJB300]PHV10079.1 peptidyl-prolyl cis-trans isomerase A [Chitinimonas sp. BJB300]TSJ89674.1 peptidyl-prolyl cis-trans isomerase [Chitinimonas sp. BJB300]